MNAAGTGEEEEHFPSPLGEAESPSFFRKNRPFVNAERPFAHKTAAGRANAV